MPNHQPAYATSAVSSTTSSRSNGPRRERRFPGGWAGCAPVGGRGRAGGVAARPAGADRALGAVGTGGAGDVVEDGRGRGTAGAPVTIAPERLPWARTEERRVGEK